MHFNTHAHSHGDRIILLLLYTVWKFYVCVFVNMHILFPDEWHDLMYEWVKLYCHYTVKSVFKGHLNIPENVSLHDICPFVTGSLTLGRYDTVLITGRPLIAVPLEDRFYCTIICIGHSIHTNSGLQVTRIPQRLRGSPFDIQGGGGALYFIGSPIIFCVHMKAR